MLTAPDFSKKQVVFVFFGDGDKMALQNSNLIIKDAAGKIKLQCTCYRLYIVFAVGHCSITSAIIREAKKFGFFIALMTQSFRLYAVIGAEKGGNFLLHRKQYDYSGLEIAKHITANKIFGQQAELKRIRHKSDSVNEAIQTMEGYLISAARAETLNELMAYEGLASKMYFKNHFNNTLWRGRQPRIKRDYVNSCLDIGYTILFTYIETLLETYGFDTYCGVMHRQFYMRKSLVCDLVEPFRTIIDRAIKNGINLRQIKEEDFLLINGQYRLKYSESARYVGFLMKPIMENKDAIFAYVQGYYRAFMKGLPISEYPLFTAEG